MKRMLVAGLVCVLGLSLAGLGQTLSGAWETDITIDPQQASFVDAITLDSEVLVDYTVGDWMFTSITVLDETGWIDQVFAVSGTLGAFWVASELDLDPDALFEAWGVATGVSIAGIVFGADFTLTGDDTYLDLSIAGASGALSLSLDIGFGDSDDVCDFPFSDATVTVGIPFCCADITATLDVNCDGFQQICFDVVGIAIPTLPWLTIDAELCFTMQTKTLVLSPVFSFGEFACIDLYFDVASTGNLSIGDISIVGIGIECNFGAVTFTGLSELPGGDLVDAPYWEVYTISTNEEACCGPFSFDVSVYFLEGGIRLFDVGLFEVAMELQVSSQFRFDMGLSIDVENANFTEWVVGFLVTW